MNIGFLRQENNLHSFLSWKMFMNMKLIHLNPLHHSKYPQAE